MCTPLAAVDAGEGREVLEAELDEVCEEGAAAELKELDEGVRLESTWECDMRLD